MKVSDYLTQISADFKDTEKFLQNFPIIVDVEYSILGVYILKWVLGNRNFILYHTETENHWYVDKLPEKIMVEVHLFLPGFIMECIRKTEKLFDKDAIEMATQATRSLIGSSINQKD